LAVFSNPASKRRATIGGNVCHNDPANHFPSLLTALGARLVDFGPGAFGGFDGGRHLARGHLELTVRTAEDPRRILELGAGATHPPLVD
jgi:hypothetical protein